MRAEVRLTVMLKLPAAVSLAALFVSALSRLAAEDAPARPPRPLWKNDKLLGSPEPPAPYGIEKAFPRIEWKAPMYIAPEPGTDKLWIVLQGGEKERPSRILRIQDDPEAAATETVLEVPGRMVYGLTFHPGYTANGLVFVFSNGPTASSERMNRVSRYVVQRTPPFACDPGSETAIIEWRSAGHDGGDLAFGHDRMLYITTGDGTSDSDTWDSGQDVTNLLAALLRIDVDHPAAGQPYSIPADNPLVSVPGARGEIWAYGFRNPWRLCVDEKTGDVWVGNNGQDLWETAYLVRRGDNFGWSAFEGSHPFYPHRRRGPTPIVPPTIEHPHSEFRSLTGGVVYYGKELPDLNGAYIYGDYSTGKVWGARHKAGRLVWHQELLDTALQIAAFRVDQRGDLLIADHGGGIFKVVPRKTDAPAVQFPVRLSDTGLFSSLKDHCLTPGLIAYSVNAPGWADGAVAERFFGLPGDSKISYTSSRGWGFPNDSVLAQTLALEMVEGVPSSRRRLETRVLLKQDGEWAGYSYRWNEEQTDAVLASKAGEEIELEVQDSSGTKERRTWRIPSRAECLACHSRAASFVLGLTEPQMNREHDHGGGPENQMTALTRMGCFSGSPGGKPESLGKLADPYDDREDLDRRARSYLHVNCSGCHVEAGGGNAKMELEISRARDQMNLFNARPQHDTFGVQDAMLIAPGDPDRSVLLRRVSRRGKGQMPPLVTSRVDDRGAALLREWIAKMAPESKWVRDWTLAELLPALDELGSGRAFAEGKAIYQKVGCEQCHRFSGAGGTVGPDLTGISRRLAPRELLESILDPSRTVADEFAGCEIETQAGEIVTGRVEREDEREVIVRTGSALDGLVRIEKTQITSRRKSEVSNMPAGILNVLERNQILDLLAYLIAEGNADAPQFKPR